MQSSASASAQASESSAANSSSAAATPPIGWVTYSYTDKDGYTLEIAYKVSLWIFLSNTDVLNKAWSESGGQGSIPSAESWGLTRNSTINGYDRLQLEDAASKQSDGGFRMSMSSLSDMYYAIGCVKIKNKTDGWHIDAQHPRDVNTKLLTYVYHDDVLKTDSLGKTYYSSTETLQGGGVAIRVEMKHDEISLPFILMTGENFTPNSPDGEHHEELANASLGFGSYGRDEYKALGVIGKDGVYCAPSN